MKKNLSILCTILLCAFASVAFGQQGPSQIITGKLVRVTPKLSEIRTSQSTDIKDTKKLRPGTSDNPQDLRDKVNKKVKFPVNNPNAKSTDLNIQSSAFSPNAVNALIQSFDGGTQADNITKGFNVVPPDPVVTVGPNHVVQMINMVHKVYDKSGNLLTGPLLFSEIAATATDDGDPISLYDQKADRYVLLQFSQIGSGGSESLIFCVSQTNDPSGAYNVYEFVTTGVVPDYPHVAIWNNSYIVTTHNFNTAITTYLGQGFWAFDRNKMIAGLPTATAIGFQTGPAEGGYLPASFEGLKSPDPTSLPTFITFDSDETGVADRLQLRTWALDFNNPASSVMSPVINLPTGAFDARFPNSRNNIEQQGTTNGLDVIGDRMMSRIVYRRFDDYESMVMNHAVNVSGVNPTNASLYQAATRWYELTRPTPASPWVINQQSTYSPGAISGATGINRWMGSAGIDQRGNIALGYNRSSSTNNPDIYYAERKKLDAINSLGAEQVFHASGGVQTSTSNRWGDYSAMVTDPSDEETMWFTAEYYPATSTGNFSTRIGSFKVTDPITTPTVHFKVGGTIARQKEVIAPHKDYLIDVVMDNAPSQPVTLTLTQSGTATLGVDYSIIIPSPLTFSASNLAKQFTLRIFDDSFGEPEEYIDFAYTINANGGNGIAGLYNQKHRATIVGTICLPIAITYSCSSPTASLSATCATGSVTWYNAAGTTLLFTGSPFNTPTLTGPTTYRANCAAGICPLEFTPITIPIFPAIALTAPTVTQPTCTTTGTIVVNVTGTTIQSGSIAATDPTQTGRLARDANPATCAGKTNGLFVTTGARAFDSYTYTNATGSPICVTVIVATPAVTTIPIFLATYLGSFVPANPSTNFLGDAGSSGQAMTSSQTVPAGGTMVVVVHEVNVGGGIGTNYTVTINSSPHSPFEFSVNNGTSWQASNTFNGLAAGNYNLAYRPTGSTCITTYSGNPVVLASVLSPANPTSVSVNNTNICSGSSVVLTASCSAPMNPFVPKKPGAYQTTKSGQPSANAPLVSSVIWYTQATGGVNIGAGSPFNHSPVSTTTYYAACIDGGCESGRVATSPVTVSGAITVLFSETFDGVGGPTAGGAGTYQFPTGWLLRNVDNRPPNASVAYVNDAWERREDFVNSVVDSAAFSTSWTTPTGIADDWMWTPLVAGITATTKLKWNAVTYDGAFPDGYEVRIMTAASGPPTGGSGAIGNQLTNSSQVFTIPAENTTWTAREVSLAAYAGQSVYIGYRNNSNDKFILLIDDVKVETIAPPPSPPTATNNPTICSGATASLSATCASGTVNWYSASSVAIPFVGSPFVTPPLSANTTYNVRCENGACVSAFVPVSVTIGTPTPPSGTNNPTICSGATASLSATCAAGTVNWYSASSVAIPFVGSPFVTPPLSANTTYNVRCESGACLSAFVPVSVTIGTLTAPTGTANASICIGATASLSATCATGTVNWYSASSVAIPFVGSPFVTPALSVNTTYNVRCESGACLSAFVAVSVMVNPIPVVSANANQIICAGATTSLSATCNLMSVSATLSGASEVPANASTATGNAIGTFNMLTNQLDLTVAFNGLSANASAGHIHNAAVGVNGPVIIGFTVPSAISGTFTHSSILTATHAAAVLAGNTYVNIHNASFPGGEVRGQISAVCVANTYVWNPGALSGATVMVSPSTTTIYTVTASSASGCSATATTMVTVVPAPTASNTGPYLVGQTISLSASSGSGTPPAAYSWAGPNSFTSTIANPTIASGQVINEGIYTVTVSNVGCTATATTNVIVNIGIDPCVQIMSYSYVQAGNPSQALFPLTNGMNIAQRPTGTSIIVKPICNTIPIESTDMTITGPSLNWTILQNVEPYALFDNFGNNIYGMVLAPGTYALTVTGYAQDNRAGGTTYGPVTTMFTIIAPPPTISAPTLTGTAFCAGTNVNVSFTTTGSFAGGNQFNVLLSDGSGSFANPQIIGTTNTAGAVLCTIPIMAIGGENYRIKVVSTDPAAVGNINGVALTVYPLISNLVSPANDYPVGTATKKAIQTINARNNITGASIIQYQAGNAVNLTPGFQVVSHPGSRFKADIAGCSN